jgi:hypothetical protein
MIAWLWKRYRGAIVIGLVGSLILLGSWLYGRHERQAYTREHVLRLEEQVESRAQIAVLSDKLREQTGSVEDWKRAGELLRVTSEAKGRELQTKLDASRKEADALRNRSLPVEPAARKEAVQPDVHDLVRDWEGK